MKTLESMRYDAQVRMDLWVRVAEDKTALDDRNKTRQDALIIASYFEGRLDAYCDAIRRGSK